MSRLFVAFSAMLETDGAVALGCDEMLGCSEILGLSEGILLGIEEGNEVGSELQRKPTSVRCFRKIELYRYNDESLTSGVNLGCEKVQPKAYRSAIHWEIH